MKRGKLSISSFDQRSGGAGYFACESKAMAVGRTILAILIAVSVALLPAAAGAAFKMQAAQAMEISATQQMDDGCPGHASPGNKAADDCTSMAACAINCFNFVGHDAVVLAAPPAATTIGPMLPDQIAASQPASPPFRPPRI